MVEVCICLDEKKSASLTVLECTDPFLQPFDISLFAIFPICFLFQESTKISISDQLTGHLPAISSEISLTFLFLIVQFAKSIS